MHLRDIDAVTKRDRNVRSHACAQLGRIIAPIALGALCAKSGSPLVCFNFASAIVALAAVVTATRLFAVRRGAARLVGIPSTRS